HLQRSQSTDADHDAFTLFFVVSTFYFCLRSLRPLHRRRWVETCFRKDSLLAGVRGFFKENRASVLYAFFAGLSVTVIALAWQGWAYVSVILLVWFAVELFLGRFRNEDTMGTWILFTIALTTPLILAFQWYLVRVQIRVWYDVPAYLFLAAFVAIFMAITAARFIFNASPAFAVVGGFAVAEVLRRADFVTMRRTYRSLAAGSWRNALRKSLKVRHVLAILGIVFLVLLPNVWWAVDASIPFELKTQYDRQVASLLPAVLRAPGYNPSSSSPYYFGAFG